MKVSCHYNSGFCIIPRVLHIQTNQLQKIPVFQDLLFCSYLPGAVLGRAGQGGHGRQGHKLIAISGTKQTLTLELCYKEERSVTSLFDHS